MSVTTPFVEKLIYLSTVPEAMMLKVPSTAPDPNMQALRIKKAEEKLNTLEVRRPHHVLYYPNIAAVHAVYESNGRVYMLNDSHEPNQPSWYTTTHVRRPCGCQHVINYVTQGIGQHLPKYQFGYDLMALWTSVFRMQGFLTKYIDHQAEAEAANQLKQSQKRRALKEVREKMEALYRSFTVEFERELTEDDVNELKNQDPTIAANAKKDNTNEKTVQGVKEKSAAQKDQGGKGTGKGGRKKRMGNE